MARTVDDELSDNVFKLLWQLFRLAWIVGTGLLFVVSAVSTLLFGGLADLILRTNLAWNSLAMLSFPLLSAIVLPLVYVSNAIDGDILLAFWTVLLIKFAHEIRLMVARHRKEEWIPTNQLGDSLGERCDFLDRLRFGKRPIRNRHASLRAAVFLLGMVLFVVPGAFWVAILLMFAMVVDSVESKIAAMLARWEVSTQINVMDETATRGMVDELSRRLYWNSMVPRMSRRSRFHDVDE
ncbi:MAG: hypothetical protein AAGI30_11545 [Planctomycetota bacterium]